MHQPSRPRAVAAIPCESSNACMLLCAVSGSHFRHIDEAPAAGTKVSPD
jgi:hypothetical protein